MALDINAVAGEGILPEDLETCLRVLTRISDNLTREAVRLAVRRCATLWTGKKPIVEVMRLDVA